MKPNGSLLRKLSVQSSLLPACGVLVVVLAVATVAHVLRIEPKLSHMINDRLVAASKSRTSKQKIVIVKISEKEGDIWDSPRVFWPEPVNELLVRINRCKPVVTGLDFIIGKNIDTYLLKRNMKSTGSVERMTQTMIDLFGEQRLVIGEFPQETSNESEGWLEDITATVRDVPGSVGFLNLTMVDGIVRSVPLISDHQTSFSYALACRAKGVNEPSEANVGFFSQDGNVLLDYRFRDYDVIAARDIMAGNEVSDAIRERLRGAIVLVGSSTYDNFPQPNGGMIWGVQIHATAIASMLEPISNQLAVLGPSTVFAYAIIMFVLFWLLPARYGISAGLTMGTALVMLTPTVYEIYSRYLPVVNFMMGTLIAAGCVYGYKGFAEVQRRIYVERVFGMNVSNAVRDLLLDSPANLELGGKRMFATVLFVDLRDSVSLAYNRDPKDVIEDLNALFASIVPAIHEHRGILSRFTGDGFLAIFGAPIALPNHASAAVEAAQQILRSVKDRNKNPAHRPLKVGCGINTGMLVCGNVGTHDRIEFTVIGDAVNLAARIEKFTKDTDHDLLISETTYQELSETNSILEPISTVFAGRKNAITVLYPVTYSA